MIVWANACQFRQGNFSLKQYTQLSDYLVGKLKILLVTLSYFLTGAAVVAKYVENEKAPNKNLKKKGMLKLKKIGFDKG